MRERQRYLKPGLLTRTGSYVGLIVVHGLSLVRHSHGNTSTVHGTNSCAVYESLSRDQLSSYSWNSVFCKSVGGLCPQKLNVDIHKAAFLVCRWLFQISVKICWNPAWQAACAGMHVINNTQKTGEKK